MATLALPSQISPAALSALVEHAVLPQALAVTTAARRVLSGADLPLEGRNVVITGGSSGIGAAAALKVAGAGGTVILVARSIDKLDAVKQEIEAAGGSAYTYSCDVTDNESVDALVEQLVADHGQIHMLVNNAGRSIRRSIALSYDRFHDFERTMSLNYFAAVRLILRLLPHMSENGFGHIVNISSIGAQTNPPRFSAYVASKAALDAFSRVVASEVVGKGVGFTTVHMPLVRTPMIAPTSMYDAFPTLSPEEAADMVLRALVKRPKEIGTPMGTFGELAYTLAPGLVDKILHQAYKVFPDSLAAKGELDESPERQGLSRSGQMLARASILVQDQPLSRAAKTMMRLLPGIHW
ncbi:SDR family NAD(P)-dependent oxidoreductase [Hoyosella altamirensis]|uniref:NAD(P)-dependent dehydrogenase (Short-subunit alcohol dehydrogenase family) n=1 Tax=Hoyosella altamirensis TaxID=616997 RepID=A0A839RU75_9ACTN|nr:SDR family NAD(P)-dependent oxidoreductase [Hoyosella altamirensis]MBB3039768.1 NAD(P)-dependent dehydrogenase (short-subunit alcohol dehydrogenase family) [Hoyosella altamirensis]